MNMRRIIRTQRLLAELGHADVLEALDELSRMRAPAAAPQAPAPEAGQAWQPIASAPRDGTPILMTNGVAVTVGGWVTDIDQGAEYEGQLGNAGWWGLDFNPCETRPTLWQPLPAPPSATPTPPVQAAMQAALDGQEQAK